MTSILVFTSQGLGMPVLKFLTESPDFEVVGVVTQYPVKDQIYGYESVDEFCAEQNYPVYKPGTLNKWFIETVAREINPDLMINAYFPKIFPKPLIAIPRLGVINVHPGNLPNYRGTYPTSWYILNGEKEFGVTVHLLDRQIDTGDILIQRMFPIPENCTGYELYQNAMEIACDMLLETLPKYVANELTPRPQIGRGSYFNKIDARYHLDWHQSAEMIQRHVRIHAKPYFPAYNFLFNHMITINKVSLIEDPGFKAQGSGQICVVNEDKTFAVSSFDGLVLVEDYDVTPAFEPREFELHIRVGHHLE